MSVPGKFTAVLKGQPTRTLSVDFNPVSLKLTVSNTLQDDKPNAEALQNVRKSTTKLEMELVFDNTETGADVRKEKTGKLKSMGRPPTAKSTAIPQVTFEWGSFSFTGVIENLLETIDFFSVDGVPLRASVQLTMHSLALDAIKAAPKSDDAPAVSPPPALGKGATDTASRAGNAAAGRAVAAANGLETMRFTAGAGLAVGGGVALGGPVGFSAGASASASAGISAGAGFSAGASAGAGVSAGASASAGFSGGAGFSAGASAGASFGASTSAGVSASAGAFAGLGASKTFSAAGVAAAAGLSPDLLRPPVATFGVSANAGASFDLTGKVVASQSTGLQADVGVPRGAVATLRVI